MTIQTIDELLKHGVFRIEVSILVENFKNYIMKYLFVFLLLGLTSVVNSQTATAEQPDCKDLVGFCTADFDLVPEDYTGIAFFCDWGCKVVRLYNYKDGKRDGVYRYWPGGTSFPAYLACEWNYKDGELDGLQKTFHQSGKLHSKWKSKEGLKVGLYREWWESNGKLKVEYPYSESGDGKLDGWYYEYYEDADVKAMGKYKGGHSPSVSNKLGIWRYYYDTDYNKGQKSKKEVYTETGDGVLISEKCWDVDGNVIQCP